MRSACLVVILFWLPAVPFAQERQTNVTPERRPIDWYYEDANYHSEKLLLKLLQFTAPYPGYYEKTSLDIDGNAFTGRIVPNWAIQGSVNAKLDDALLGQIRQMLGHVSVASGSNDLQLQGQMHSTFVFFDGHQFGRFDYNGTNPSQIDGILQILHKQFRATVQRQIQDFAAHERFIKETYGDWQNRPGITVNAGGQMHGCNGNRALVVLTSGLRKPELTNSSAAVSVYHALVFYPGGAVSGAGSGGRWGDDPLQSYVVIWRLPNANGSFSENTSERRLEILHNAIDGTIGVGGKTYHLNGGNMFIIRLGDDWVPTVTQLADRLEDQATPQVSLDRFKAILKQDASIQALELY